MRTLNRFMKTSLFVLSAMAALPALKAEADDNSFKTPMIQVGGGVESRDAGINVLVKAEVGYSISDSKIHGFQPIGTEQMILLHITGNASIATDGGKQIIPYMDVQATIIDDKIQLNQDEASISYLNGRILSANLKRDISIDQSLMIRATLIGVSMGKVLNPEQVVSLYGQLGVDVVGYKMAAHVSDASTFHGFHIANASAEGGAYIRIAKDFGVRISVGGNADISWKPSFTEARFASDLSVYTKLSVDISKFFQIFVQAGLNGAWDSADMFRGGHQVMAGVIVAY